MNAGKTLTVAVTGAAGGLGSTVVRELNAKNIRVRALITERDNYQKIEPYCAKIIIGSIENFQNCTDLLEGCEAVINCAALLPNSLDKVAPEKFHSVNFQGAKNIFEAAQELKLKAAIFLSTIGVIDHTELKKQKSLYDFRTSYLDPYSTSKIELEKFLQANVNSMTPKIAVVRPAFIYGPQSIEIWLPILQQIKQNKFKILGDGQAFFPIVYEQDLAQLLVKLLTAELPFQSQPIVATGPHDISTFTLFQMIAKELGATKVGTVPVTLAYVAACIADLLPEVLKIGPAKLLSKRRVKEYSKGYDLSFVKYDKMAPCTEPSVGIRNMLAGFKKEIQR